MLTFRPSSLAKCLLLAVALTNPACWASPESSERDRPGDFIHSASAIVVDNVVDTADLPIWRLDTVPALRIGTMEGGGAASFARVRAALTLSNGTLVVADGESRTIRLFNEDGAHTRTVGGHGSGPGEYQEIDSLDRFAGDSLVVFDAVARRATVMTPEGATVRVVPVDRGPAAGSETHPGIVRSMVPSVNGGWLVVDQTVPIPPADLRQPVLVRQDITVVHRDDDGRPVEPLAVTAGSDMVVAPPVASARGGIRSGYQQIQLGHALQTHVALRSDGFYVGENSRFEIRQFRPDGSHVRTIRYSRLDRPYTDDEFQRRHSRPASASTNPLLERMREVTSDPAFKPDMRPSFGGLEVDAQGNLWVLEWGGAGPDMRWIVFNRDGVATAIAEVPRGLSILSLGVDHAVGVDRDELGIEYVSVWHWVRGG